MSLCKKDFLACFQKPVVLSHTWKLCLNLGVVFAPHR